MIRNDFKKKEDINVNAKKVATIVLMLAVAAFVGYHLFLTVQIANEKLRILDVAESDVAELRVQNLELVLEKSEIVSLDYIEKEARDKLRYSGEEETLFVIPDDLLNSEIIDSELNSALGFLGKEEEKTPEEILQLWLNFLFVSGV